MRKSKELRIVEDLEWNDINLKENKYKKTSSGSYIFNFESGSLLENIKHTFGISNEDLFNTKFEEAISGDGDESKKMISVKSSSLCALLCFYNVSKEHPIAINGEKYTKSFFEVKNQVFNNPSNMDVVLTNEEDGRILFVECKFSEYLNTSPIEISNAYEDNEISGTIYREAMSKGLFSKNEEGKYYSSNAYMGGLKQIISHYVGLINYVGRGKDYLEAYCNSEEGKRIKENIYDKKYKEVKFIEVVYKFRDSKLLDYYDSYHNQAKELIKLLHHDKIEFLEPTTYKDVFADNKGFLDRIVGSFYKI